MDPKGHVRRGGRDGHEQVGRLGAAGQDDTEGSSYTRPVPVGKGMPISPSFRVAGSPFSVALWRRMRCMSMLQEPRATEAGAPSLGPTLTSVAT